MELVIRPAIEADFTAITAIYSHSVRMDNASFELEPPDCTEMKQRWRTLVEGGYPYIVAAEGDMILGYAYAGPYRPRRAYRFAVENTIYVAESAKRRGIGNQLLKHLIERCEAGPYRQMIAVIGDTDNPASTALHAKHGFALVGQLKAIGYKHDRWLDTIIMQRPLGAGDTAAPG